MSLTPAQAPATKSGRLAGRALGPIRNHLTCLVADFASFPGSVVLIDFVFFVSCLGPDFRDKVWTFGRPGAGPIRNQLLRSFVVSGSFFGGKAS